MTGQFYGYFIRNIETARFSDILYPQSEVSLSSSDNDYEMGNSYDSSDASLYSKCQ